MEMLEPSLRPLIHSTVELSKKIDIVNTIESLVNLSDEAQQQFPRDERVSRKGILLYILRRCNTAERTFNSWKEEIKNYRLNTLIEEQTALTKNIQFIQDCIKPFKDEGEAVKKAVLKEIMRALNIDVDTCLSWIETEQ
jgi:hypothetical protein